MHLEDIAIRARSNDGERRACGVQGLWRSLFPLLLPSSAAARKRAQKVLSSRPLSPA